MWRVKLGSVTEWRGGERRGGGKNNKLWSMAEVIRLKRAFMPSVPSVRRHMQKGRRRERSMGAYERREDIRVRKSQETNRQGEVCGKQWGIQYACVRRENNKTEKAIRLGGKL